MYIGDQSKYFVGIPQATLSGKTRLIIEASVQEDPIILITLHSNNLAFYNVLLPELAKCSVTARSFEERLYLDKKIMLLVRYFFLSFLQFMDYFCLYCAKSYDWIFLPREVKLAFSLLLLKEGGQIIEDIFRGHVASLENRWNPDKMEELRKEVIDITSELAQKLGRPGFAIDNCQLLLSHCVGVLFHSHFEVWLESRATKEQLLKWQLFEQHPYDFRNVAPAGYPYGHPTSLFNAFRQVCEDFLFKLSMNTVFTSNYFSGWENLVEELYSREKPRIQHTFTLPMVTESQILDSLISKVQNPQILLNEEIKSLAQRWQGRPGLFFEIGYSYFQPNSTKEMLLDAFRQAENAVLQYLERSLRSHVIQSLLFTQNGHREEDTWKYLQYIVLLHNGVCLNRVWQSRLIASGIAVDKIMHGKKGIIKVAACVQEKLVQEFILKSQRISMQDIETILLEEAGEEVDELAGRAVALSMLVRCSYAKTSLLFILEEMGIEVPVKLKPLLKDLVVKFKNVGSIDEFGLSDVHEVFGTNSPLWDGAIIFTSSADMPDLLLSGINLNEKNRRYLISLQIKTWPYTPSGPRQEEGQTSGKSTDKATSDFQYLMRNITITHPMAHAKIKQEWDNVLTKYKIFHIRMILNWGGFTGRQHALTRRFNEDYYWQPVFLVQPSLTTGSAIYGSQVYRRLSSAIQKPSPCHPKSLEVTAVQTAFMEMSLRPEEDWRDYIKSLPEEREEESLEDSDEEDAASSFDERDNNSQKDT